ncbi:Ropporin-1-like protein [Chamberlinius hualienensis]
MSTTLDSGYLSSRVIIPAQLPELLKHFTKSAIKTQPKDILAWSAGYFKCIIEDQILPVKERLELIEEGNDASLGVLRIINAQLKKKDEVSLSELKSKCWVFGWDIEKEVKYSGFGKNKIKWESLLLNICQKYTKSQLEALTLYCEVLTEENEGSSALIPAKKLIMALGAIIGPNSLASNRTQLIQLAKFSKSQNGLLHPGNLKTILTEEIR